MSFVEPQDNSTRYTAGIVVAVVFHIVLVWALMNGLARQVVQAISAPIETKLIEEVKPPPPPPKVIEMPPPPKFTPPPPAFVPPPEVQVQAPPPQPTITATVAEPPATPPPPVMARPEVPPLPPPVAPTPVAAPPNAAPPVVVSASVACSNYRKVMGDAGFPREATRLGLEEGNVVVQFTLSAQGEIRDVKALNSSHASFEKASIRTVSAYKCAGQGRELTVQVPFLYKSE